MPGKPSRFQLRSMNSEILLIFYLVSSCTTGEHRAAAAAAQVVTYNQYKYQYMSSALDTQAPGRPAEKGGLHVLINSLNIYVCEREMQSERERAR